IEKAFALLHKFRIESIAFFVIGNPGENETTIRKSINLAIHLNPDFAQFTMATPYPGTRLYDIMKKEDKLLPKTWKEYGHYTADSFYTLGELTPEMLNKIMRLAYFKFYLRPIYLIKFLTRPNTWLNFPILMKRIINGLLELVLKKNDKH
ncbi:MAG: hypothetical protein AB1633_00260, partial [Elusimicrobiota bacterium]